MEFLTYLMTLLTGILGNRFKPIVPQKFHPSGSSGENLSKIEPKMRLRRKYVCRASSAFSVLFHYVQ